MRDIKSSFVQTICQIFYRSLQLQQEVDSLFQRKDAYVKEV